MDSRPLVTYAGDQAVFAAIEPGLVGGLPTESIEWKRYHPADYSQGLEIYLCHVKKKTFAMPGAMDDQAN